MSGARGSILERFLRSDGPWYLLTTGITALIAYVSMGLWYARLDVPWAYQGDALPVGAHFKTVLEEGWYEHQPRLGAPFGQFYHDFPTADNLHLLAAKILGLFTQEWAVAMNMYYFLGYVFAAATAFWFFRVCVLNRPFSLVAAALFALAPYHFIRNEGHLWLASYYAIPLALGLLIYLLRGQSIWTARTSRHRWWGVFTGRGAFAVVAIGLVVASSSYSAVFFLVLVAAAGLGAFFRDRSWSRFFGAIGVGLTTVGWLVVNMLPDMVFTWLNGSNPGGFARLQQEAELYGLKFTSLILPWPGHQIDRLASIRHAYDSLYPLPSESPALGLIAAMGLVAAFVILPYLAIARRRGPRSRFSTSIEGRTIGYLAALLFVCFLCATMGGLSTIVSFFTPALRGWNRMSIMMALFALGVTFLCLQWLIRRALHRRSRPWERSAVAIVCVVLLGIGYIDQTPKAAEHTHPEVTEQWDSDAQYFRDLEQRLPDSALVLQLPYLPFPEFQSSTGQQSSEHLIPYLHTTSVLWSAGGIKGRPTSDWPYLIEQHEPETVVLLAAAAGASGILLDTKSLDGSLKNLARELEDVLGESPFASADRHWQYFDLAGVREQLRTEWSEAELDRVRTELTAPVTAYLSADFLGDSTLDLTSGEAVTWSPTFTLVNPGEARPVQLNFDVDVIGSNEPITVTLPDGSELIVEFVAPETGYPISGPVTVTAAFMLPAGESHVMLSDNGTPTAPLPIRLSSVQVMTDELASFIDQIGGQPFERPVRQRSAA